MCSTRFDRLDTARGCDVCYMKHPVAEVIVPKFVSKEEQQRIYETWLACGSFDKAAKALGISISKVVQRVYIAQGKCPTCCKPFHDPPHVTCPDCRARCNARNKVLYQERVAKGLCGYCGKNPIAEGHASRCASCAGRGAMRARERNKRRKSAGLCSQCKEPIAPPSTRYCARHAAQYHDKALRDLSQRNFAGRREAVLAKYGGKCALCGRDDKRIEVHHIDYDRTNNAPENLIVVCRFCHGALTHLSYCLNPLAVLQFFLDHNLSLSSAFPSQGSPS